MARYIDADELINDIENVLWDWDTVDGITATTVLKQTITDIKNQPTADVVEVKHGKWVEVETKHDIGNSAIYECSLCGRKIGCDKYPTKRVAGLDWPVAVTVEELFPYCHCGAKMEEETESKRIDTLKKVSRMIAEGKIPNEVYDEYLSDTPLGFRTADEVLEYLLYGG